MNYLFFGMGSIGQRHLRNLLNLDKNAKIYAFRKKYSTPLLNHQNKKVKGSVKEKYEIDIISDLKSIKKKKLKINAAFICTPSSMHVAQAAWCIKNNINVFIEKPVATNLRDLNKINKLIKKKPKNINLIGYQLRFNPLINFIKNFCFDKKKLGEVYNCEIYHGEHVDHFHSYESYKNSYTSNKKLGGGVVLTQIHELDYLNFFLSSYKLKKKYFISNKISELKLDVEDNYISIFHFVSKKNNNISAFAKVTCSFNQIPKKRTIFISCRLGSIFADLSTNEIRISMQNKKDIYKKFNFDRNQLFVNEIKNFINLIKTNGKCKRYLPNILEDNFVNKLAIDMKI